MPNTHFTQWIGDNVDHNLVTLNGEGGFHGMGVISISTKTATETFDQAANQSQLSRLNEVSNEEAFAAEKTAWHTNC